MGVEIAKTQLCVVVVSHHSTDLYKPSIISKEPSEEQDNIYQASLIPRLHLGLAKKSQVEPGGEVSSHNYEVCTVSRCGVGVWLDRLSSSHFGCATPIIAPR